MLIFKCIIIFVAIWSGIANPRNETLPGPPKPRILIVNNYPQVFRAKTGEIQSGLTASQGTMCFYYNQYIKNQTWPKIIGTDGILSFEVFDTQDAKENVRVTFVPSLNQLQFNVFGVKSFFEVDLTPSDWHFLCYQWQDSKTLALYVNATEVSAAKMPEVNGDFYVTASEFKIYHNFDRFRVFPQILNKTDINLVGCKKLLTGNLAKEAIAWNHRNWDFAAGYGNPMKAPKFFPFCQAS